MPKDLSIAEIAAFAAAGSLLIGAFFGGIVSVVTAWRTMAGDVSAIKAHVNSEKTAAEGRENTLKAENALLREAVTKQTTQAALLAQAASHSIAAGLSSAPVPVEVVNTPLAVAPEKP